MLEREANGTPSQRLWKEFAFTPGNQLSLAEIVLRLHGLNRNHTYRDLPIRTPSISCRLSCSQTANASPTGTRESSSPCAIERGTEIFSALFRNEMLDAKALHLHCPIPPQIHGRVPQQCGLRATFSLQVVEIRWRVS